MRDPEILRSQLNKSVRLVFKDGEIVDVMLLGVDPTRDRDLTYEITRIVDRGAGLARGTKTGATCIASLDELADWQPLP